jgi:hypothetical protein
MPWNRYALGYHGCDAEVALRVVSNQQEGLRPSENSYDWLGHGQYFWEENWERAWQWACSSPRIQKPAVLGAVIDLGECLNLSDAKCLEYVSQAYDYTVKSFADIGRELPTNKGRDLAARHLDCAVFEALHLSRQRKGRPPFDTVRAFFAEGQPLYKGAGVRGLDHVQICVRNPKVIHGYFLPRLPAEEDPRPD